MADFRKDAGGFRPGDNAHRSPGPTPSSLLPSRERTASLEHRVQCAGQGVLFEIEASPDRRTKEREAQRKRHLSRAAAFAILSDGSIVSDDGASFLEADSV